MIISAIFYNLFNLIGLYGIATLVAIEKLISSI